MADDPLVESMSDVFPTPSTPEVRFVVGMRQRFAGLLDFAIDDPPPDPAIGDLVNAAAGLPASTTWVLAGGEPTLRGDLPQLIEALVGAGAPSLTLLSDGLLLTSPKIMNLLVGAGLNAVRLRLHSSRFDAHDWLCGQKGAAKRVIKALQVCRAVGLTTEVEITVTRPTRPYLVETVQLLSRLGVSAVHLRRITGRGAASKEFVAVSPRFGLAQPTVEAAVQEAIRCGVHVTLSGFPRCAAPGAAAHRLDVGAIQWVVSRVPPWPFMLPRLEEPGNAGRCAKCPGPPECGGAPQDYVDRFGMTEVRSEGSTAVRIGDLPPCELQGGDVLPPVRLGRYPATRLSYVRRTAARPSLQGDPVVGLRAREVPASFRIVFCAPSRVSGDLLGDVDPPVAESTRSVRIRLVRLAQHGVPTLRIASAGSLGHPNAAELLREATRLSFESVEVAGEGSPLDEMSNIELRRLRGLTRLDVALYGPDAKRHDAFLNREGGFDATLNALDRLSRLAPSVPTGCYAIIQEPKELIEYAKAWELGDLPGTPAVRLHPDGGELMSIAHTAEGLPEGEMRDAVAAVLPPCLLPRDHIKPAFSAKKAWGDLHGRYLEPSGSDRLGCYTQCSLADRCVVSEACPGLAVGWSSEGIDPVLNLEPREGA